jgi:hypothetical protein
MLDPDRLRRIAHLIETDVEMLEPEDWEAIPTALRQFAGTSGVIAQVRAEWQDVKTTKGYDAGWRAACDAIREAVSAERSEDATAGRARSDAIEAGLGGGDA